MFGGHTGAGPTVVVVVFKLLKPSNLKFLQIWFDMDDMKPEFHPPQDAQKNLEFIPSILQLNSCWSAHCLAPSRAEYSLKSPPPTFVGVFL